MGGFLGSMDAILPYMDGDSEGWGPFSISLEWTFNLALAFLSISLENAGHRAKGQTEEKRKPEKY